MQWRVRTTATLSKASFQLKTAEVTSNVDLLQIPSILQRDLETVLSRLMRNYQTEPCLISMQVTIQPTSRQLESPSSSSQSE